MEDGTMNIETKEKVIDGVRFSVAPFRVVEAARLHPYLIRLLGPSVAKILGALFKKGLPTNGKILDENLDFDGNALSQGIENLVSQLTEDEFEALMRRMFFNVTAYITKNGTSLQLSFADQAFDTSMDIVFAKKVFSIYPVMLFVLEANFPDFLAKMGQGFGLKMKKIITSEPGDQNSNNESEKSEA
jgi:hypothetical protein